MTYKYSLAMGKVFEFGENLIHSITDIEQTSCERESQGSALFSNGG